MTLLSEMTDSIRLFRNAPLQSRNTFGVAATAPLLAEVADADALTQLFARDEFAGRAPLVLGGGSNLLFAGDPDVPLLALTGQNIRVIRDEGDVAIVRADAGVEWHGFVQRMLGEGFAGLENLSLIPGTVGAAPIQNIGAYGVEVREFVHAVECFEPATGKVHRIDAAQCAFAYRDSVFKHEPDRYIVTAVEFALPRTPALKLDYAGIGDELTAMGITNPTPRDVAQAVIAIRRSKLPDPAVLGNAGSFFKNPIVPLAQAEALHAQNPAMPVFRGKDDHTRKLSAAWFIDNCGWKGHRDGDAGIAPTHALVLVNHGSASGQELLSLARRVADSVRARFAVSIEPEPRIVGASW